MITLSNNAKVLAAYIVPKSPGHKPHGIVLAETETDWVTWDIYWDGIVTPNADDEYNELWEAEAGHYWHKTSTPGDDVIAKELAELDFGSRLRRNLTSKMREAFLQ